MILLLYCMQAKPRNVLIVEYVGRLTRLTVVPKLEMLERFVPPFIGAKRGGTREQCSQKLFELAEIFGKIKRLLQKSLIYFIYNKEKLSDEAKVSQMYFIFKIFSGT